MYVRLSMNKGCVCLSTIFHHQHHTYDQLCHVSLLTSFGKKKEEKKKKKRGKKKKKKDKHRPWKNCTVFASRLKIHTVEPKLCRLPVIARIKHVSELVYSDFLLGFWVSFYCCCRCKMYTYTLFITTQQVNTV